MLRHFQKPSHVSEHPQNGDNYLLDYPFKQMNSSKGTMHNEIAHSHNRGFFKELKNNVTHLYSNLIQIDIPNS